MIKGYRPHAQQDTRTCIACLLMDGTFYETAEEFTDHVQGRCAVVPVTRTWEELGVPGIPDTNADWQPGREWFLEQDDGTQRDILGDPIFNAWKSGGQLPAQTPESEAMSKGLKRRGFQFVGPTICYAFMQATGMVNDHLVSCFRHEAVAGSPARPRPR